MLGMATRGIRLPWWVLWSVVALCASRLQVGETGRRSMTVIRNSIAPDTEAIYTDDWPAYDGIADHDTMHETVNHSAEDGLGVMSIPITVENVWSLFKRSVVGSYHKVTKHLDAYLDELEWRF